MPIIITGLPYFSLNVKNDDAVKLLEAEFGLKGFALYIHLLQRIYGEKGYYTKWDMDVKLLFANKYNASKGFVSEIVNGCLRRGIFDNEMYTMYGVLTSKEIQENYFYACKRRKGVKVINEILLTDPCQYLNNDNILREDVNILGVNVNISGQRKEENIKENVCCDYGKMHYITSEEKTEDCCLKVIDNLSDEEVTKLKEKCDKIIYNYWGRRAQRYDYETAAAILHVFMYNSKNSVFTVFDDFLSELLEDAVSIAAENDARKWSYVKGIFRKWGTAKIKDYVDYAEYSLKQKR